MRERRAGDASFHRATARDSGADLQERERFTCGLADRRGDEVVDEDGRGGSLGCEQLQERGVAQR